MRRTTKKIQSDFFKKWSHNMGYLVGYIAADGCITISKDRISNPYTVNITSIDLEHIYFVRKVIGSEHKVSRKTNGRGGVAYQLHIRNRILAEDLMRIGITPRKTFNLKPINVPNKYFPDFVRGFFDGDGTVYVCKVNGVPQIKAGFVCASLPFIRDFNSRLCAVFGIPRKSIHREVSQQGVPKYSIDFYIDDCNRLSQFMYRGNPTLFLSRKRHIFESWQSVKRRRYIKRNYPSKIDWKLNPIHS